MDRYEKILKIETHLVEGKVLDPEQRAIVLTKATVEKSMTDLKTLLTQLEDVAKEVRESYSSATLKLWACNRDILTRA
jgi:hypothetical protein